MSEKYTVLLGPNTNQLWVYDEEENVYIDPPADVLDEVDGDEEVLMEIVDEEPDWLFDEDYWYDADDTDV